MSHYFLTTKPKIEAWLQKYDIRKYTINHDLTVDVNGNVDLYRKNLEFIPVRFQEITGHFNCSYNQLTSLKGCPQIVGLGFACAFNLLTSLEFCPRLVGEYFSCGSNRLSNLEFCPPKIGSFFDCCANQLTSLEFCPQWVGQEFFCAKNKKLGKIQQETDFQVIYAEHLKTKIEKEKVLLKNSIRSAKNESESEIFKL